MKIMIIVGTRPEIIRLSEIIKKLDKFHQVVLVHTGQNYDYNLNDVFFKDLKLRKPDYYLNSVGDSLGQTVGNIIAKSYDLMIKEKPDALLILGDTNSCLSSYSAKRLKIPIFHMEAGNRCFDLNVPEEINRRLIDHISDINLAYSINARQYLISEGFHSDNVYVTGSPMTEVLKKFASDIESSNICSRLKIDKQRYFVVSLHREENVDTPQKFRTICNSINAVADEYQFPIVFSTHPRTRKRIEETGVKFNSLVHNLEPLGFIDYNALQTNSFCVLSDSGTLAEESAIMHFPSVSIRTSTERPESLDAGVLTLSGDVKTDAVLTSIKIATQTPIDTNTILVKDYQDTNVSDKILKIISSYTSIINTRIWNK